MTHPAQRDKRKTWGWGNMFRKGFFCCYCSDKAAQDGDSPLSGFGCYAVRMAFLELVCSCYKFKERSPWPLPPFSLLDPRFVNTYPS